MGATGNFRNLMFKIGVFAMGALALVAGDALAGDGWGDNTNDQGVDIRQQTFYANSPSGVHSKSVCPGGAETCNLADKITSAVDSGTPLRKFVDPLPPLSGPGGPLGDSTGKYIPLAVPTKWRNAQGVVTGDDYYEIAAVEWKEKFHSDLANDSTVRGYVQIDPVATDSHGGLDNGAVAVPGSKAYPLTQLDGVTPVMIARPDSSNPTGFKMVQAYAVDKPHYLGPVISAMRGTPSRIKFINALPVGRAANGSRNGDLFLPVDETLPGAGFGPDGRIKFTQNRVEIHLHGGDNPWISDGTPHQWIAPAGEADASNANSLASEFNAKHAAWQADLDAAQLALNAAPANPALQQNVANLVNTEPKLKNYLRGASAVNVPDMPDPGPGAMTYYFPNGESARLMFYHDHAFGLTRLNVYAGVAAGYLLNDDVEQQAVAAGKLPAEQIPLVFQDKTFVPKDISIQDARWDTTYWGQESDFWFPHVYETNQDPTSVDGTKPVGRWDWGPYFWPVFPSYYDRLPKGSHEPALMSVGGGLEALTGLTEVTTTPEAFVDTPIVNGQAYPTMEVEPKAYRFRMLNAMNDRFINLGLYMAADKVTTSPDNPNDPMSQPTLCDGSKRPDNSVPSLSDCTEVKMVNFDSSYPNLYYSAIGKTQVITPNGSATFPNGTDPRTAGLIGSGWGDPSGHLALWAGVPDPATAGPDIVQIGNEGGVLAKAAIIPSTPMNYEANKRSTTMLNILERGLWISPAGRADAVIDFSQYAGKTLILYNDAPAPLPAGDPRIDYYTGMGDYSTVGGHSNVLPGYGPNDRTVMQIYVKPLPAAAPLDVAALETTVANLHGQTQPKPVVPESRYAAAFSTDPVISTAPDTNARIYTGAIYLGKYNGLTFKTPEDIKYTDVPRLAGGSVCTTPANCAANLKQGSAFAAAGSTITAYVENKAIQELFEPTYGRMNATLGVELPFTSSLTQTTIPLGYVDPATEKIADGETQFWKITHNGVDSHPVHFHLVNVQVINRMGWDGTIKQPTDEEIGWKETVIMNPLEDIVVAVRAKAPKLPFGLPNSVRSRDPSQPNGPSVQAGFTQVDPVTGNPAAVYNKEEDFGWEYVWHCHILGHEENDFMRAFVFNYWDDKGFQKNPDGSFVKDANGNRVAIVNLAVNKPDQIVDFAFVGGALNWTDPTPSLAVTTLNNPKNEIGFHVYRTAKDGAGTVVELDKRFNVIANATSFTDAGPFDGNLTYTYQIAAYNQQGEAARSADAQLLTIPVAPSALVATAATASTVSLTWNDNATNESVYKVQYSKDAGATWTTVNTPANLSPVPSSMAYTLTGLAANTDYVIQVAASNAAGDAFSTPVVAATTNALAATTVAVPSVTDTTATLTWTNSNPNSATTNTVVTVTDVAGLEVAQVFSAAASPLNVTNLTPNTAYTFSVVVTGANGVAATAATTTATTNAAPIIGPITFTNVTSASADVLFAMPVSKGTPVVTATVGGAPVVVGVTLNASGATVTGLTPNAVNTISVANKGSNNFVTAAITGNVTTDAAVATGVLVSGVTDTTANVAWTNPGANGTAVLTVSPAGATVTQTGNAAVVTGLTSNTIYTFSVVVKGANGVASAPATAVAVTNASAATAFVVDSVSASQATVHWTNPVSNGTAVLSVSPFDPAVTITTVGNSSTVSGLTGNTQYTFSVVVVGSNNVASPALTKLITTNVQAVASLNVTLSGLGGSVTWNYASAGSSQVVFSVSPSANVAITPTGASSANVGNLAPNTAYTFNLNATGVNGNSVLTSQIAQTNAIPVTNLQVTNITTTGANVSWTNANPGISAAVLTVFDPNGVPVAVTQTPVLNGVTVSGLAPHTQYVFSVVVTGITNVPSATTTASIATPATLLAATNVIANAISATKVQLTWTDNSLGETGYTVEMRRNNGAWAVVPAANIVGELLTPNGVANVALSVDLTTAAMSQARYQFRVTPVSDNPLVGPVSAVATIDLTRVPNATVINAVGGVGNVVMTWVPSTNTQSITVQRRRNNGVWTNVATILGNSSGHTDSGLLAGTYQYRLTFRNPAGTRVNTTANIVVQ